MLKGKDKDQQKTAIREHNAHVMDNKNGTLDPSEVRDFYQNSFSDLVKSIQLTRVGGIEDAKGNKLPAYDLSLGEAVTRSYGVSKEVYFRQMGIDTGSLTLEALGQHFGAGHLNDNDVDQLLIDHSKFASSTDQVPSGYRFIIPELIMDSVRVGYEGGSLHNNWISSTNKVSQQDFKMPQIHRGNMTPRRIGEAESIPFGSLKFGQKSASTFKIGMGFKITDELVRSSTINMLSESLREVGIDMSIGADVEAMNILINGEQSDGSESAPVIGVENTVVGVAYHDLLRATTQAAYLKRTPSRMITDVDEGININLLPEFKGYNGQTQLSKLNGLVGIVKNYEHDLWPMPPDQVMLLHPQGAMMKFEWIGMKVETRRNPQTQQEELFISQYLGYAIKGRDSRIIIDGSIPFASNGFPSYMDVDSRISTAYRQIN